MGLFKNPCNSIIITKYNKHSREKKTQKPNAEIERFQRTKNQISKDNAQMRCCLQA